MTDQITEPTPPIQPSQLFEQILAAKFHELRPSFNQGDLTPEQLAVDPIFHKLFVIDRTMLTSQTFEVGYVIWENCNQDLDKYFEQFRILVKDGNLFLEPIQTETDDSAK